MGRGGAGAAKGLGWLRPRSPDGAPTREAQGIHGRARPGRGAPGLRDGSPPGRWKGSAGARDPRPGRRRGLLATPPTSSGAAWATRSERWKSSRRAGRSRGCGSRSRGSRVVSAAGTPALRRPRGSAVPGPRLPAALRTGIPSTRGHI